MATDRLSFKKLSSVLKDIRIPELIVQNLCLLFNKC